MRIIDEEDFGKIYGKAKQVLLDVPDNNFLVDMLEQCTMESDYGKFIYYANKLLEVPPVKSFLLIFQNEIEKHINGKIDDKNLKQSIGCWFAYLFQQKYGMQKAGVKQVGIFGVSVATYYKKI